MQQYVIGERGHGRTVEQFLCRQPCGPGFVRSRDHFSHAAVEFDEADANAGKLARHRPGLHQRAAHQLAEAAVGIIGEIRQDHTLREQRLTFGGFVQFKRVGRGQDGGLHIARRYIGRGQFLVGAGQIRLERQGPLDMGDGVARMALRRQRRAQSAMRFGMVRLKREDLAIICRRRVEALLLRQHIGEIEPCRRRVRRERQRTLITGDGFREPALLAADIAEIEMGEHVIAAQCDGALQMRGHLIRPAERTPRQRDVVVIFRLAIVGCDGLPDKIHCRGCVAAVERNEPEIVQTVGMRRYLRQDIAIAAFGLGEGAALMMRDRRTELFGDRACGIRRGGKG